MSRSGIYLFAGLCKEPQYPIPLEEIQGAVAQRFLQLGWTSQQQKQFILELFEKPQAELNQDDWEWLLFEVDSHVQDCFHW